MHDELVAKLAISAGDRVLDVATGAGAVAIRATLRGADVTGVDIAPAMLDRARSAAGELPIRFDVGDAQALPYADAAFDVVASCFGAIFAPDHDAVARELARVCRDRLGLTVWVPNPDLAELYRRFELDTPERRKPFRWGADEYAERLLGSAFELTIERRTWVLEGEDGAAIWEVWSTSSPPFKAMVDAMPRRERDEFRLAYVAYCERFREDGRVRFPRDYLLILGRRR